jgi:hypothetical protein
MTANQGLQGERHPNSKLTEEDVRNIRAWHGTGVAMAKYFKVSPTHIHLIRKLKRWKHVK